MKRRQSSSTPTQQQKPTEPSSREADAPPATERASLKLWPRPTLYPSNRCVHGAYFRPDETAPEWRCYWCDEKFDELPRWQFYWDRRLVK